MTDSVSTFGMLHEAVQDVLNRFDPLGVSPRTFAPADEYAAEATIFMNLLLETGIVTVADVRNIGAIQFRDTDWIAMEDIRAFISEMERTLILFETH